MWNVFDTSFIIIFLLYIMLRIKGLATGDGEFRTLVSTESFSALKPRFFQNRRPPLVLIFWLAARASCSPGDLTYPSRLHHQTEG